MQVTRVIYHTDRVYKGALTVCSIVFDDCLLLNDICLYKQKDYFITYPSKQDVYNAVGELNEGVNILYPTNTKYGKGNKSFEEYFHPLTKEFYSYVLECVVKGYKEYKKLPRKVKKFCYRVNNVRL